MKRKLLIYNLILINLFIFNHFIWGKQKDPEYERLYSESEDFIHSFSDDLYDKDISPYGIFTNGQSRYITTTFEFHNMIPISSNMNFTNYGAGGMFGIYYFPYSNFSLGLRGGHVHFFPSSDELEYLDTSFILPTFSLQIFQYKKFRSNLILSQGASHIGMELKNQSDDSNTKSRDESSWEYAWMAELDFLYDITKRVFIGLRLGYAEIPNKADGVSLFSSGLTMGYTFFSK